MNVPTLTVCVPRPTIEYSVHWGCGGFVDLGERVQEVCGSCSVLVVSDSNVAGFWREAVERSLASVGIVSFWITLPAGEATKSWETVRAILDEAMRIGVDRGMVVLALGGGVVGDVAGFSASVLHRGLRLVQVPTSVLAMVDSSVGGKTAVNVPAGKNLVGSFHHPSLVYIEHTSLSTLPSREFASGMVEAFKVAAMADEDLFSEFESRDLETARGDDAWLRSVVQRCIQIKADLVARDERDGGARLLLNLGHTFGHALEAAMGFGEWLHGEAVGVGLIAETDLACRLSLCEQPGLPIRLRLLLERWRLPNALGPLRREALREAMALDKKSGKGILRVPMLVRLGKAVVFDLPSGVVFDMLSEWK